jgi:hypothetical protein
MTPYAHIRWLRPVLRTFTSLREVSLAATALRPLSRSTRGGIASLEAARREAA